MVFKSVRLCHDWLGHTAGALGWVTKLVRELAELLDELVAMVIVTFPAMRVVI